MRTFIALVVVTIALVAPGYASSACPARETRSSVWQRCMTRRADSLAEAAQCGPCTLGPVARRDERQRSVPATPRFSREGVRRAGAGTGGRSPRSATTTWNCSWSWPTRVPPGSGPLEDKAVNEKALGRAPPATFIVLRTTPGTPTRRSTTNTSSDYATNWRSSRRSRPRIRARNRTRRVGRASPATTRRASGSTFRSNRARRIRPAAKPARPRRKRKG
jgi:hypothetical protein